MRRILAALVLSLASVTAHAQSVPSWMQFGVTPSAPQWQAFAASKQDYNALFGCAFAPCQAPVAITPNGVLSSNAMNNQLAFSPTLPPNLTIPSPNITGTVAFQALTLGTPLGAGFGGTGAAGSLSNGLVIANGTSPMTSLPPVLGYCAMGVGSPVAWGTAPCSGGSVSSVGFAVPGASIFGVTGSPVIGSGVITLTTTGTPGGVPYFSSTAQLATSAQLTAGLPVVGGGAGAAPSSGTRSGITTEFVTASGTYTPTHAVVINANGDLVDAGGPPTIGGGGGTVTSSFGPQLAQYASGTGTVVAGATISGCCAVAQGGVMTAFGSSASLLPATSIATGAAATNLGAAAVNTVFAGPATGSTAVGTYRVLVGADLPNPSASSKGGVQSVTATTNYFLTSISTSGVPGAAQPSCGNLSNAAPSCSIDATNAANISGGTLPAARLPTPSATALGGVESVAPVAGYVVVGISTSGVPQTAVPTLMLPTTSASITAAGSNQSTALGLTSQDNVITSCPSGAGVLVSASWLGAWVTVLNKSGANCNVYPPSGAAWNTLAVNAAAVLASGAVASFKLFTATQGYTR